MSDDFKLHLPKLAEDGSSWIMYCDHIKWLMKMRGLGDHLTSTNLEALEGVDLHEERGGFLFYWIGFCVHLTTGRPVGQCIPRARACCRQDERAKAPVHLRPLRGHLPFLFAYTSTTSHKVKPSSTLESTCANLSSIKVNCMLPYHTTSSQGVHVLLPHDLPHKKQRMLHIKKFFSRDPVQQQYNTLLTENLL